MSAEKEDIKPLASSSIAVLSLIREIISFILMQEYKVIKGGLTCDKS